MVQNHRAAVVGVAVGEGNAARENRAHHGAARCAHRQARAGTVAVRGADLTAPGEREGQAAFQGGETGAGGRETARWRAVDGGVIVEGAAHEGALEGLIAIASGEQGGFSVSQRALLREQRPAPGRNTGELFGERGAAPGHLALL